MAQQHELLTARRIFWFWLPLAAMWVIMSAEQPAITAVVSRLPQATENLAAFGITFALSLIVESPVIMLLTAGTALATHQQSYRRLLNFTTLLALIFGAVHLLLPLTPLYALILRDAIGTPVEIIETSRVAFLLMTPWTPMIAFRRLWEGVMIRYGHPERVTLVIAVRLAATVAVLLAGLALGRWPGAYVGGVSLSVGVTVGALAAWWFARPTIQSEIPAPGTGDELLEWGPMLTFYGPLALTTLITMVGQPILAFGLSRAPLPLESLAIWPVMMALVFIGRSFGIAYQEVVVALLRDSASFLALRRFGYILSLAVTGLFFLLTVTPGAAWWYRHVSGLTPDLAQLAILPTLIMALVPGLNGLLSWYRGVLVANKRTAPIGVAVGLNMGVLLGLMLLFPLFAALPGAVLAAIAFTASLVVECLYLWWESRSALGRFAPVARGAEWQPEAGD